jgi:hypothetical protein
MTEQKSETHVVNNEPKKIYFKFSLVHKYHDFSKNYYIEYNKINVDNFIKLYNYKGGEFKYHCVIIEK